MTAHIPIETPPVARADVRQTPPRRRARRAWSLFWRNGVASIFSFAVDMAILWALVEWAGWGKMPAAALGFIVAMTVHYAIARVWVFRGADRGLAAGYVYFFLNQLVGLGITLGLFALLMAVTDIHYLVLRVLASLAAGLVAFTLNAVYNFKML